MNKNYVKSNGDPINFNDRLTCLEELINNHKMVTQTYNQYLLLDADVLKVNLENKLINLNNDYKKIYHLCKEHLKPHDLS